jgi:hypothetical protein
VNWELMRRAALAWGSLAQFPSLCPILWNEYLYSQHRQTAGTTLAYYSTLVRVEQFTLLKLSITSAGLLTYIARKGSP